MYKYFYSLNKGSLESILKPNFIEIFKDSKIFNIQIIHFM